VAAMIWAAIAAQPSSRRAAFCARGDRCVDRARDQPATSRCKDNGETGMRWLDRAEPNVPKARESMLRGLNEAGRAADIIERIRAMATGGAPQPTALSLHDAIAESMLFPRHEHQSKGVSVSLELAPALPQVTGDRTQLNQVIVNLVINAVQAMVQSGAGRRSIFIRTVLSDPETCAVLA